MELFVLCLICADAIFPIVHFALESVIFCLFRLRKVKFIHPARSDFRPDRALCSRLMRLSIPVAIQNGAADAVTQMPPMSSLPPVSVYQAMQAQPVNIPQTALEGTPIMVHTVQGAPVVVTKEEMERALASLEEATDGRKKSRRRKKDAKHEGAKTVKVVSKFSVFWMIFGVIGIAASAYYVWNWGVIPLLVWLHKVTGGAV